MSYCRNRGDVRQITRLCVCTIVEILISGLTSAFGKVDVTKLEMARKFLIKLSKLGHPSRRQLLPLRCKTSPSQARFGL